MWKNGKGVEGIKGMSRSLKKGFIQSYIDYTHDLESPELFHFWACVSVIGSALGRKCFVNRGYFTCYPNEYIILVSESARCRKTTSAEMAIKIYRKAEITPVLRGDVTKRALSKHMDEMREKVGNSFTYLYAPELGTLLGSDSYINGLMTLITDFYDCPEENEHRTQTQGTDVHKDIFLSIMGCTTPSWLAGMPPDMVEGGFSSRALFIVQNTPRSPKPRPTKSDHVKELELMLIEDMKSIHALSGGFQWSREAETYFDEWYIREYNKIDTADIRLRAYYGRKGEHLLKLCMVLSASRGDSMVITHHDIEQGLLLLSHVEKMMSQAFRGFTLAHSTKHIDRIMQQIEEAGGEIIHSTLMKNNHLYMDKNELEKVMDTLRDANMVRMELKSGGVKKYIVL